MSEAAQRCDAQGFCERPPLRLTHRGKDKVVIGAKHRMEDGNRGRGIEKYLRFSHLGSLRPTFAGRR